MKNRLAVGVATWFGCGWFPWGPGTVGSLAGLALAMALNEAWRYSPAWLLAVALALTPAGIWAADVAAKAYGKKDPGFVVVDEVLGQWVTLAGAVVFNWKSWLLGLLLFRLFDIWKPYPIRRLEALPGGVGIVADDLLAGVYGAAVLFAAGWFQLY